MEGTLARLLSGGFHDEVVQVGRTGRTATVAMTRRSYPTSCPKAFELVL